MLGKSSGIFYHEWQFRGDGVSVSKLLSGECDPSVVIQPDNTEAEEGAYTVEEGAEELVVGLGFEKLAVSYQPAFCDYEPYKMYEQAEKEVLDLRQRTREGIQIAKLNGKQVGQVQGRRLTVKKEAPAKEIIKRRCRDFGGSLTDAECVKLAGISRNTFYKYKRELWAEYNEESN